MRTVVCYAKSIKLNPGKTALVVVDLQKGIARADRKLEPHTLEEVVNNAAILAAACRHVGAKVFLVHVTSSDGKDMLRPLLDEEQRWSVRSAPDWADFIEEVAPTDNDIIITKRQWGAFHGTELDLQLRRRRIDTIVLCGIATNIGVETTAREAYQHGYNLVIVEDAMNAMSAEEHEASLKFIFPRIGLVRSTRQTLTMLGA